MTHKSSRKDNMRIVESSNANGMATFTMDFSGDTYESYKRQVAGIEEQKYGKDIPSNVKHLDGLLEKISSAYYGQMERTQFEDTIIMLVKTLALYKDRDEFDRHIPPCSLKVAIAFVAEWAVKNFTEEELAIYFD